MFSTNSSSQNSHFSKWPGVELRWFNMDTCGRVTFWVVFRLLVSGSIIQAVEACKGDDCDSDWWKWLLGGVTVVLFLMAMRFCRKRAMRKRKTCDSTNPTSAQPSHCKLTCKMSNKKNLTKAGSDVGEPSACTRTADQTRPTVPGEASSAPSSTGPQTRSVWVTPPAQPNPPPYSLYPPPECMPSPPAGPLYLSGDVIPPPAVTTPTVPPPSYQSVVIDSNTYDAPKGHI